MQVIRGANLLDLPSHGDDRGELVVLEENTLPFAPKRIFFITIANSRSVRAEHAGTSEELIVPLSGAVTVDLDNGEQQTSMRLADRTKAIWVKPGVWLRLREFEPGTILLVAASLLYSETRHFDGPQPLDEQPLQP